MGRIDTDKPLYVTTSWDDGYPSDLRLADLLDKHGAHGTFYVPNRNSEGRPVLNSADIRRIGQRFEIGGHTLDHVVLTKLPPARAHEQVVGNKHAMEDLLGRELRIFAYVRGRYDDTVIDIVKKTGFRFARTVKNLASHPGDDPFRIPTTTQFFAHTLATGLRNFVSGGATIRRAAVLSRIVGTPHLANRCTRAADTCARSGGYFHLWGHSWELDQHDLWDELDRLLSSLRDRNVLFVSNSDWYAGAGTATHESPTRSSRPVSDDQPSLELPNHARQRNLDQPDRFGAL